MRGFARPACLNRFQVEGNGDGAVLALTAAGVRGRHRLRYRPPVVLITWLRAELILIIVVWLTCLTLLSWWAVGQLQG